jgi:glycosyltransferase involved in cell wall biosynthesis
MTKPNKTPITAAELQLPQDLVCFSHLRWNFVYQRPQHLLSRFSKHFRLFFIEEPIFTREADTLQVTHDESNVWIVVPHLTEGQPYEVHLERQKQLLDEFFSKMNINKFISWYYTPMALKISDHLSPDFTVYDCMDELSAFKFAPPELRDLEAKLFSKADVVFTGGQSLYEAKKHVHKNIHPFPSSIDKEHFNRGRLKTSEPVDQAQIPHPRIGFYGVIDERMDIDLIGAVAAQRPEWHFVIIGPVVKIDPASLPRYANIHYLGSKTYQELPDYLSGWDITMIPFALNESTRFISPTKTPEYLAAGKPVISTSIHDVIHPYGTNELVHIADTPEAFIQAVEKEINTKEKGAWLRKVDEFLLNNSWDNTWKGMMNHIIQGIEDKQNSKQLKTKEQAYV